MYYVNTVLNPIFHTLMFPFRDLHTTWGLLWIALITAVVALLVYRFLSNQEAIRAVKNRLKAHLLEARLFQHDPVLMGRAVLSLLKSNGRYLSLNLKPFLFMLVPVVLILIHMEARYGFRPLHVGDSVVVRTFWETGPSGSLEDAAPHLDVSGGLHLETPALRIASLGEVNWRVRATAEGVASLRIRWAEQDVVVPVEVSRRTVPVSPWNGRKGSLAMLWNPAAYPLPASGAIRSVEVDYPRRDFRFLGVPVYWIWPYFVVSLLAGFLLKGFFRVQI